MKKFITVTFLLIFLLSGCATMSQEQKSRTGTGLGSLIGAGVGELLGDSWKATAIGAVGGGVIGNSLAALLGNQQNHEQAELLKQKNNNNQNTDEFAEKLNLGSERLSGTTCHGKVNVEIKITGFPKQVVFGGPTFRIYGKFNSTDPQGKVLKTNLKGIYFIEPNELRLWGDDAPTLSVFGSEYFGDSVFRAFDFQRAKEHKDFPKFIEKYEPYIQDSGERYLPEIPLAIDIIRDSGGEGWIGAFEGRGFEECREMILAGENATATGILPPMTEQQALRIVDHVAVPEGGSRGRTDINRLYWLNIAAENGGSFHTVSRIDQILQKQEKTSSQDYKKVVKYYQSLANDSDQRAQRVLAKMYAEGNVIPKNLAESNKLLALADATLSKAEKACASPRVLEVLYALYQKHRKEAQAAAIITTMFTGMDIDPGDIRITEIAVEDVVSMDKSFTCSVYGERIGMRFDASTVPDVEYYSVDQYGNHVSLGDNSGDKAVKHGLANIAQKFAERSYEDKIELKYLDNTRIKLESGSDSVTIDLD